jgi:hypothetical protein
MTLHPKRCATCDTIPCPYHEQLKSTWGSEILEISKHLEDRERMTECVGCASHSTMSEPPKKKRAVIDAGAPSTYSSTSPKNWEKMQKGAKPLSDFLKQQSLGSEQQ